ncbi:MAG TPA: portal protein, partial [Guyparkeria sp.]|nr:portal protein [Guyparkeria sp.]
MAYDDGQVGTFSLRSGAINPGGVNAQGRPLVHPLPTGNLAVGADLMEQERLAINDAFLVTLFQILVESHTMTATEVLERAREKGMLLAPTAGRLEAEFLGPLIQRELDVLGQLGMLPEPPPVLAQAGAQYTVEYDNPMARMVRSENAAGFMRSLETALGIAERTGDPSPLDWFNFDEAIPAIQEIHGAPVEWTSTVE